MVGEAIGFTYRRDSITGVAGINSEYEDLHLSRQFITDLGDPGGSFPLDIAEFGGVTARTIPSQQGTKAWLTPGTKTLTQTVYRAGMVAEAEGSAQVVVRDPETYPWDVTIYHGFGGNAPVAADNLTVFHSESFADARAWRNRWDAGDDVRIILADNSTMDLDVFASISLTNNTTGLIYIHNESMGAAGTHAQWTATTTPRAFNAGQQRTTTNLFLTGSNAGTRARRIVMIGLDIEFGGNGKTGVGFDWVFMDSAWIDEPGSEGQFLSFTCSEVKGFYNGLSTGGSNTGISTADAHVFFYNVDWGRHYDYCHFHGTGRLWPGMNGCRMLPDPHTATGDAKNAADFAQCALAKRLPRFLCRVGGCRCGGLDWRRCRPWRSALYALAPASGHHSKRCGHLGYCVDPVHWRHGSEHSQRQFSDYCRAALCPD